MHKRTAIVCIVGPASSSVSVLKQMIESGMNVARINFSHGDHDGNLALADHVRAAAEEVGKEVAILQDLQGPKMRVGTLLGEGIMLKEGSLVRLQAGVQIADPGVIPVPYDKFAYDLGKSDRILLADGTRELEVVDVQGNIVVAKVLLGGMLISNKGIHVPTVTLSIESRSEKDDADLAFGLKQNIDFVALSFVRSADDVSSLKQKIIQWLPNGVEPPQVIVKIEKHEALENFDEILEEADGIMIARGDLGLETSVARVPIRQKEIIAKCVVAGKPVITAMSDVANAVIDHADAVMLSGESAMGKYPTQVVVTMAGIITQTEESPLDALLPFQDSSGESVPSAVAAAAVLLARHVDAKAILVTTKSGYSARQVSRFRPELPIFAATTSLRTMRQLLLSWGVTPFMAEAGYGHPEKMMQEALTILQEKYGIPKGSKIVVMSGLQQVSEEKYDSSIRVRVL